MNDEDLVLRTLEGDMDAFAQLVQRYQSAVYNLAYRMLGDPHEAEDAAQETFLRCYAQLQSYIAGRRFSTWLLSVASHLCVDLLRRRRFSWLPWDESTHDRPAAREDEPESVSMRLERQREFQSILGAMSPKYRLVTILRYWHDLSHQEIAEATGLTESAVKTRLFRAREWLARTMLPMADGGARPGQAAPAAIRGCEQPQENTDRENRVEWRCDVVMLGA